MGASKAVEAQIHRVTTDGVVKRHASLGLNSGESLGMEKACVACPSVWHAGNGQCSKWCHDQAVPLNVGQEVLTEAPIMV
jgi:hypothetical protein